MQPITAIAISAAVLTIVASAYLLWRKKKPTLYDRLGGIFPISAVVSDFSDALLDDPIVGRESANPYLRDWNNNKAATRLPGLKWMRTLWLADISGGPYTYRGTKRCPFANRLNLSAAHAQFHMKPEEFNATAKVLSATLDKFGVKSPEKDEVLGAFAAHMSDIVGMQK